MNDCYVTRRDFLRASSVLVGTGFTQPRPPAPLRFGLVTDIHYADIEPAGVKQYRQSTAKLADCVRFMNEQKVDFLVELGDFKDQGKPPDEKTTLGYLQTIEDVFRSFKARRYHVLGNHDVDSISKQQFLEVVHAGEPTPAPRPAGKVAGSRIPAAFYSFDTMKGVLFLVLDANFCSDGTDYDHGNYAWEDCNVPAFELAWMERELVSAKGPVIVFVHQRLDGEGGYYVKNAAAVRAALERSKKVLAVFQGHQHEGGYSLVNGIHYYTLKAVVEGSGVESSSYAIVEADPAFNVTVSGYRRAEGRVLRHG